MMRPWGRPWGRRYATQIRGRCVSTPSLEGCQPALQRLDSQLLSDLWFFRAAARAGSITQAASALSVTQGAVSQRVLRLEARLGVPLFERHNRRISLTRAGEVLLAAFNDASGTVNEALVQIGRLRQQTLVVACPPTLAIEWLMPNLPDLYRGSPGLEVHIRAEMVAPDVYWMEDQRVDLVIGYSHVQVSGLHQLASFRELIFPVCSPATLSRLETCTSGREVLALHDDNVWQEGERQGAEWREWFEGGGARCADAWKITAEQRFNLAYLAYQAAMYGDGLAMARSVSVERMLQSRQLVPACCVVPVPSAHYRMMSLAPMRAGSALEQLVRWLLLRMETSQARTLDRLGISGKSIS